ncbi:MAG: type II secretion system major pseudopilin GspG [Planctomycetes bacterium]|jgi:general secretion pathway protein G|nr:type II secretion system major pseudopilin GspG [Planctomycetota bacterium]
MKPGKRRGFSLIELMVVITIIAMLAGGVAIFLFGALGEAKQAAAKKDLASFETALSLYRMKAGKYPDSLEALTRPLEGQTEPYLKEVPKDPWGKDYDYQKREGGYLLRSFGADGTEGGEGENADVTNQAAKKD